MFVVLLGTSATVFYNLISNMLRALGDSNMPLYFLVFSSILNIFLDLLFIVPFHMGVAGAAWATVISQLLSAFFCLLVGLKKYQVLHISRQDFDQLKSPLFSHLKIGFQMGFQMSVMCIGQLAMQAVVNSLGTYAVAGYTAASKADQVSVLVNNAMIAAISAYVSQNFGAGNKKRIRLMRACMPVTDRSLESDHVPWNSFSAPSYCRAFSFQSNCRNLFLLRPVLNLCRSLLLSFGITVHLPGICTKYGKWLGSIYCLYDRTCYAHRNNTGTFCSSWIFLRLHRQPPCMVRSLRTADFLLLPDDEKTGLLKVSVSGPSPICISGNDGVPRGACPPRRCRCRRILPQRASGSSRFRRLPGEWPSTTCTLPGCTYQTWYLLLRRRFH